MNNAEVVYVPIKGNSKCIYPVYIPIIIKDKETYRASGSLSSEDYEDTKNNLAGFPALLPIISALAPLAITGLTKLGKHIFKDRITKFIRQIQIKKNQLKHLFFLIF